MRSQGGLVEYLDEEVGMAVREKREVEAWS